MATRFTAEQIAFRYRVTDSPSGVTRDTAKRIAEHLGVDETQAIHRALHELAARILPQYEPDDGPLSATQMRQIRKHAPQGKKSSLRSSLFDSEPAKMKSWGELTAGEIVWCHFPDNINPRPKPRPALIVAVFDDDAPLFTVRVAYGTSQKTTQLYRGEFAILQNKNPAAYAAAGLSYDTKFNLRQLVDLSYTAKWFSVPPAAPHGQTPLLGTLHPSMVRAVQAAYREAGK